MKDVEVMQGLESDHSLDKNGPNLAFLEQLLPLLVVDDLLVEVAIVRELHHDAACKCTYHKFLPSRKTSL